MRCSSRAPGSGSSAPFQSETDDHGALIHGTSVHDGGGESSRRSRHGGGGRLEPQRGAAVPGCGVVQRGEAADGGEREQPLPAPDAAIQHHLQEVEAKEALD